MVRRISILTAVLAIPQGLAAQPSNVNDCTLIRDPIELRNCILRYGGERVQPPPTVESNSPQTPPPEPLGDSADGIVEVPVPRKTRPSATPKRTERKIAPAQPAAPLPAPLPAPSAAPTPPPPATAALPKPNPKDTLVHIEQIDMSKARP